MIQAMKARNSLRLFLVLTAAAGAVAIAAACGGDDDTGTTSTPDSGANADSGPRGVEPAGQACTSAAQCYLAFADGGAANPDAGDAAAQLALKGTVACLDKVPNGYCTHECQSDSDCCAVPNECRTKTKQVCAPLENTSSPKYCFLSCEDTDIQAALAANDAGNLDGGDYCQTFASQYASCRSTGGGKENRKICFPQQ
jgi:hypothetical protein